MYKYTFYSNRKEGGKGEWSQPASCATQLFGKSDRAKNRERFSEVRSKYCGYCSLKGMAMTAMCMILYQRL